MKKICSKIVITTTNKIDSINNGEIILLPGEESFEIKFIPEGFYGESSGNDTFGLIQESITGNTLNDFTAYIKNCVPPWIVAKVTFSDGDTQLIGDIDNPAKMDYENNDSLISISIVHERINK